MMYYFNYPQVPGLRHWIYRMIIPSPQILLVHGASIPKFGGDIPLKIPGIPYEGIPGISPGDPSSCH